MWIFASMNFPKLFFLFFFQATTQIAEKESARNHLFSARWTQIFFLGLTFKYVNRCKFVFHWIMENVKEDYNKGKHLVYYSTEHAANAIIHWCSTIKKTANKQIEARNELKLLLLFFTLAINCSNLQINFLFSSK